MNNGSVTLNEVILSFKNFNGKASSKKIENYIIEQRGNILPQKYASGGWDSYRKTINQVIQFHCKYYKKYRGPEYFKRVDRGIFELIGYSKNIINNIVSNREIELYKNAHKYKISESEFEKILNDRKLLGAKGEEIVINHERQYLVKNGHYNLSQKIQHVAKYSVSEGFDIISYDLDGNNKFIEVKTSIKDDSNFYITDNEIETAKRIKENYWLYHVIINDGQVSINYFQNPYSEILNKNWILKSTSYLVLKGT